MRHAFKLGPIPVSGEDGDVFVYCAMGPDGLGPPVLERSDEAGLRGLLRDGAPGPLVCAPELGGAAAELGLQVAALPQAALVARASLAVASTVDAQGPGGASAAFALADAFVAFCQARPWDRFDGDVPVPVTITIGDGAPHEWEASVMGMAGEQFGLALYERPGSLDRVGELFEAGHLDAARRFPSISVSLDPEPAFAAEAFEEAYGIPGVPGVLAVARGRVTKTSTRQNVILSAALLAFARLPPAAREGGATLTAGRHTVAAWVTVPDGSGEA